MHKRIVDGTDLTSFRSTFSRLSAFVSGCSINREIFHKIYTSGEMHLKGIMHPPNATFHGNLRVYKLVLLGEGGVGKSALIVQLISHQFLDYHDPTIEDSYQHQVVIDNEPALLDILDTAGQQEFTAMREQYMRNGEGFVIMYSITDRNSFKQAAQYKDQIERVRRTDDIPVVLVGNKDDLECKREVTTQEGQELAHRFDCPFYETSAAQRHSVDDAFHSLVRKIRQKEKYQLMGHVQDEKKGLIKCLRNLVKCRGRKSVR